MKQSFWKNLNCQPSNRGLDIEREISSVRAIARYLDLAALVFQLSK
jgi:hypothetical protein